MNYAAFYYLVEFIIIDTQENKRYNVTKFMNELYLLDDYINNISTIIKLSFQGDIKQYEMLYDRGEKLRYFLSISSKSMEDEMVLFDEVYMDNMELKPLVKPTNNLKDKTEENGAIENREEYKNIKIDMTFIPIDVYNSSRNVYNNIISNCSSYTAGAYILKDVKDRTILYEKPDNSKIYDQIFVPPNNFAMSLRFIQQHYGIYATGISIYFKNHYLYVKNRMNNSKTPSMKDKKPGSVFIRLNKFAESDANSMVSEGTLYNEENNYYEYRMDLDSAMFHNNTLVNEELWGNLNTIYDRDFGNISHSTYTKEDKYTNTKRKYYMNYMSNPMLPTEMFYNSLSKPESVSIGYNAANLNMFSIENTFKITIYANNVLEDKYAGKTYQVSKNEMLFNCRDGNFNLSGAALLVEV